MTGPLGINISGPAKADIKIKQNICDLCGTTLKEWVWIGFTNLAQGVGAITCESRKCIAWLEAKKKIRK